MGYSTCLVFTLARSMSHECTRHHKDLPQKLSEVEQYERHNINVVIPVELSFLPLKATFKREKDKCKFRYRLTELLVK